MNYVPHAPYLCPPMQEPDPAQDVSIELDGHAVVVPLGPPLPVPEYRTSSFTNSEYLLYKESQQRIRYMVTVDMP